MTNEQQHHWIKPGIRGLPAANPLRVDAHRHRLQWNENPYEFPADLKEIVLERLARAGWARYPLGLRPWSLIDRIATHNGVGTDQVVAGPGSSDLIKVVMNSVLHAGDNVVLPSPTFLAYRPGVRVMQANSVEVPLAAQDNFALPVDALIEAAEVNEARLVVICAPNNPTGTVYQIEDMGRIAAGCPGLLLVDAAYSEFSGQDFAPLLAHDNVMVLHTFSKLYAMAGVRVGYVLTSSYLAGQLQKAVSDFPLSVFAELTAEVALEHSQRFEAARELDPARTRATGRGTGANPRRTRLSQWHQLPARAAGSPEAAAAGLSTTRTQSPGIRFGCLRRTGGLRTRVSWHPRTERSGAAWVPRTPQITGTPLLQVLRRDIAARGAEFCTGRAAEQVTPHPVPVERSQRGIDDRGLMIGACLQDRIAEPHGADSVDCTERNLYCLSQYTYNSKVVRMGLGHPARPVADETLRPRRVCPDRAFDDQME